MSTPNPKRLVFPSLAAGWLLMVVAGCAPGELGPGDRSFEPGLATSEAQAELRGLRGAPAFLRAIHLSPDAPAVDVFADRDRSVASDLSFTESGSFEPVRRGSTDVQVSPAGAGPDGAVLEVEGLQLDRLQRYTAAVFGTLDSLTAVAFADPKTKLRGDIQVRAIHAASGVGQVDIWNIPAEGDPAPLYENVDYGTVGGALQLPAAAYTIGFDVDDDASPDLIFDLPALEENSRVNLFAVRDSDGAVYLTAQFYDGTTARIDPRAEPELARIRAIHLSPDAPAVDIYVNGAIKAVEGLAFNSGTSYLELEAGSYDFGIVPGDAAATETVLEVNGLSLAEGGSYTAVAFDRLNSISALALMDDYEGLGAGDFRVRAVHTASAVGQVDIWAIPSEGAPIPLWVDLDFGSDGGYLDLPAAAYTIGFDVNDDADPDVLFDIPALPAGTVANVFAVSDSGDAVYLLAQLPDGSLARIDPSSN